MVRLPMNRIRFSPPAYASARTRHATPTADDIRAMIDDPAPMASRSMDDLDRLDNTLKLLYNSEFGRFRTMAQGGAPAVPAPRPYAHGASDGARRRRREPCANVSMRQRSSTFLNVSERIRCIRRRQTPRGSGTMASGSMYRDERRRGVSRHHGRFPQSGRYGETRR